MAKAKEPKLDEEFMFLLPPQTVEERAALRQSVIDEGIREPLVVWKETGVLVDGHNRFDVAKELKIPCKYVVKSFKDRAAVIEWIVQNQLGRRNLTPEKLSYFRGKQYLAVKKTQGGEQVDNLTECPPAGPTSVALAEKHNVSEKTIRRDAAFAAAVDASPDKAEILAGTSGKSKAEVIAAAPLHCERCSRIGPVKDCPKCKELGNRKAKKAPKPPKSGEVIYDWKTHDAELGRVVRSADKIAARYPGEKFAAGTFSFTPEFRRFTETNDGNDLEKFARLLDMLVKASKSIQKRVTKS